MLPVEMCNFLSWKGSVVMPRSTASCLWNENSFVKWNLWLIWWEVFKRGVCIVRDWVERCRRPWKLIAFGRLSRRKHKMFGSKFSLIFPYERRHFFRHFLMLNEWIFWVDFDKTLKGFCGFWWCNSVQSSWRIIYRRPQTKIQSEKRQISEKAHVGSRKIDGKIFRVSSCDPRESTEIFRA